MKSHGSFTLKLEEHVVHTYACSGFNELWIMDYRESILKLVGKESSRILFEHVEDSAGATPEALTWISDSMKTMSENTQI